MHLLRGENQFEKWPMVDGAHRFAAPIMAGTRACCQLNVRSSQGIPSEVPVKALIVFSFPSFSSFSSSLVRILQQILEGYRQAEIVPDPRSHTAQFIKRAPISDLDGELN